MTLRNDTCGIISGSRKYSINFKIDKATINISLNSIVLDNLVDLKIDKITFDILLSEEYRLTLENSVVNLEINLEKCEYPSKIRI